MDKGRETSYMNAPFLFFLSINVESRLLDWMNLWSLQT